MSTMLGALLTVRSFRNLWWDRLSWANIWNIVVIDLFNIIHVHLVKYCGVLTIFRLVTIKIHSSHLLLHFSLFLLQFIPRFLMIIKKLANSILYPVLPILSLTFTISYFAIGIYVYKNPNLESLVICNWWEISNEINNKVEAEDSEPNEHPKINRKSP